MEQSTVGTGQESETDASGEDLYHISHDYGWAGDITDETKAEFIDHFMGEGASSEEPFYVFYGTDDCGTFSSYYNEEGELQLEFYYDEAAGVGCGIRYVRSKSSEGDTSVEMKGFAFNTIETVTDTPENEDIFSVTYYDGNDGSSAVEDYEESYEYNDAGWLTHYESTGMIDSLRDAEEYQTVIAIDFAYREDGTLCRKESNYNPHIFGTTRSSSVTYFDEQQRAVYSEGYITHGSLDSYYIYDGDSTTPSYVLTLDDNLGYWYPNFSKYE